MSRNVCADLRDRNGEPAHPTDTGAKLPCCRLYQRTHSQIFLNSDIEYRHFYFAGTPNLEETSDQQNERYLSGAMKTGCRAIMRCLEAAEASVKDIDLLAVCSGTGYVCPDLGSRPIAHMGLKRTVRRASISGLGCAGAVPSLQRAADFRARDCF